MNKVTDQVALNKRCAGDKVNGLLDSDIPSCSENSLNLVSELLGSISESQSNFKKELRKVDGLDKAYGSFPKNKAPEELRKEAIANHKKAYTKVLIDKLDVTKEVADKLKFDSNTNDQISPSDLKSLVQTKVSSLPDKLTETPTK